MLANSNGRLVVSDGSFDADAKSASVAWGALPPILIGLMAPITALMMIDPAALRHANFLLTTTLIPVFLLIVAIYLYCVAVPGDVVGIVIDPDEKTFDVVRANAFATRHEVLPFAEVVKARLSQDYDADGYGVELAALMLASGDHLLLPAGTGEQEVAAINAVLSGRRSHA